MSTFVDRVTVRPGWSYKSIAKVLLWWWAALAYSTPPGSDIGWAGRRVDEALIALQRDGFAVIFSSETVPDSLRVTAEPRATDARSMALQILQPFRLGLRQVGPGLYAVVRIDSGTTAAAARDPFKAAASPALPLEQIIVAASRYSLAMNDAGARQLDRTVLTDQPKFADDALRAVARLPGVASNGLGARVNVRGGDADELLILMDGFPIRQSFHVPAFFGPVSSFDAATIAALDVYTGGFPLRFGGRMSGVIDLSTVEPDDEPRHSFHAGSFDGGARTAGSLSTAADLDGLVSVRAGTLRSLVDRLAPDVLAPFYTDGLAKLRWRPSDATTVSAQLLWSRDAVAVRDAERGEFARLSSRTSYLWLHAKHRYAARWRAEAWLGHSALQSERAGSVDNTAIVRGYVDDRRTADLWDLRWRLEGSISERQYLEFGGEWQVGDSDYRYRSAIALPPAIADLYQRAPSQDRDLSLAPFRRDYAMYGAYRFRPGTRMTSELGVRALRAAGLGLASELLWDPRLVVSWNLGLSTRLRLSWGRFHQLDEVQELRVDDGVAGFLPAQRSDHTIIGLEHVDRHGVDWRAEVFRKTQAAPRPRYENQLNPLAILPELAPDRQLIRPNKAELRGIELSATYRAERWSWQLGYTASDAIDDIAGQDQARSWDQTHAFSGAMEWRRRRWSAAAAFSLHSGWPTTQLQRNAAGQLFVGPRNDVRWPNFASLDLRASYRLPLRRGELVATLDITNALDRVNRCCSELTANEPGGGVNVAIEPLALLPMTPSFAVRWNF